MPIHPRRTLRRSCHLSSLAILLCASGSLIASGQDAARQEAPQTARQQARPTSGPDTFGRLFQLPVFAPPTPDVRVALMELGRRGGLMDANDDLTAGPLALIVDPALSINNPDSLTHTAGVTFMGQFLDHDMTFDRASRLGQPSEPRAVANARRPVFDLDSVYGNGPAGSPELYEPADPVKFRVETGGRFEDLPRDAMRTAIIGDPRNDENLIIAGLHAAFLLFHNRAVDLVRAEQPSWSPENVFAEARRLTTWHYQWLIVHEILPAFVGAAVTDDVLTNGRRYYVTDIPYIPIEFQIVYRFGHSMVRPSYRANFTGIDGGPFFAMVFEGTPPGPHEPGDLRGGVRSERRFIGWQTFFSFPGFETDMRRNKRIDTRLSTPLFDLPLGVIVGGEPPVSLAQRNLLRHLTWRVPSGQAIAQAMGLPALTETDLSELLAVDPRFTRSTPLWYYVLREAEVFQQGNHLGPVGGRILAEVFIGLLQLDPDSYLRQDPGFIPSIGGAGRSFSMIDFLTFAGVAGRR